MKPSFLALAASLALAGPAAACAGGDPLRPRIFSTDWLDDQGKSIAAVQARLKGAPAGGTADLVVAVAGEKNDKLIGAPLSAAAAGRSSTRSSASDDRRQRRPRLGRRRGLRGRRDATGKRLWARPTGGARAARRGRRRHAHRGHALARHRFGDLVVGRDGAVKREIETDKQLGDPAVVGGVVLVPWANQYVSADRRADRRRARPRHAA